MYHFLQWVFDDREKIWGGKGGETREMGFSRSVWKLVCPATLRKNPTDIHLAVVPEFKTARLKMIMLLFAEQRHNLQLKN